MGQKHQTKNEIVREQQRSKALKNLREEVEWLHLNVQRDELQEKLTGIAIDAHIESFIDLEINIASRHPEISPVIVSERTIYLQTIQDYARSIEYPINEQIYMDRLNKNLQGRKEVNAPVGGSENPSEQLHAIKEQIDQQQEKAPEQPELSDIPPETPAEVSDETTGEPLIPVVEPADEVSQPLSGEPPEPDFSNPEHPANQRNDLLTNET